MNKEIINRIQKWRSGKKAGPYSVELSPTLRCNLNCMFCWRQEKENLDFSDELSKEKYMEILEQAKELDVKEIKIIGGGESTFRKDTIAIMEKTKELGFFGYICTNSILFTEKDIKKLVEIKWNHLKISFHGPNQKTHDKLTQIPGSFEKVVKNIKLIKKYKKENNSELPYIEFGVVLGKTNYKKIPDMVELADELKVNAVFIEPITVYSELGKKLKLNKTQEKKFELIAKKSYKKSEQYNISTNLNNFFKHSLIEKTNSMQKVLLSRKNKKDPFLSLPCYEPFYRIGIRCYGVVCPCGFFDEGSTENINEKSLKEIWFGNYFEKRRQEMINNKLSPYCAKCCTTLVSNNLFLRKELKKIKND